MGDYGELLPARKTKGGTRYYNVADIMESNTTESPTICYARVSSHDQREDLVRQQQMLEDLSVQPKDGVARP